MNNAKVSGKILKEFKFSYKHKGINFYETTLAIERVNESVDEIPIIVSEKILRKQENWAEQYVNIEGCIRAIEEGKVRKVLIIANSMFSSEEKINENEIFLQGYIGLEPTLKVSKSGIRFLEFSIEVKRRKGKRDFISCIVCNEMAIEATKLNVGDEIKIYGSFQSKKYLKRYLESEEIKKAFAVCIKQISKV